MGARSPGVSVRQTTSGKEMADAHGPTGDMNPHEVKEQPVIRSRPETVVIAS